MRPHPTNPHGVLVPCAVCGRELHVPRDEEHDWSKTTCSYDCMISLDLDPMPRLLAAGYREQAPL